MPRRRRKNRGGVHPPPDDAPPARGSSRLDREGETTTPPRRRSSSREQSKEPGSPPAIQRSAKRTPVNQEVPFTSPARTHPATKFRPMLGDLKVHSITLVTPKEGGEEWHQAMFSVTLEKKRILLKTNKEMWLQQQPEIIMSKLRQKIIDRVTELEMDTKAMSSDILMSSSLPWEKAWLSFQNQVLQQQMEAMKRSSATSLGHKSKADAAKEKKWSVGEDFKDPRNKYKAKMRVITELEKVTGKELSKAHSVLSSIVSGLTNEPGFNELAVLSENTWKRLASIDASITSAHRVISKMTKSMNLGTAKVLTAVTAVLLPPTCLDKKEEAERREFCKLLSINGRSKYFEYAVENRKEYNSFLELEGDISVGEKVSCRGSPEAQVTVIEDDGSVTVSLLPFGTEKIQIATTRKDSTVRARSCFV